MTDNQPQPASEWLDMTDAEFADIRDKTELILRTLPDLLDKSEASARATLTQRDTHELDAMSRKRLVEQLLRYAEGSLQQSGYMRGLMGMLDSTLRCLDEMRRAYRAAAPAANTADSIKEPANTADPIKEAANTANPTAQSPGKTADPTPEPDENDGNRTL